MGPNSYTTVARPATGELVESRSRFLAQVARVDSQEAARAYIYSVRDRYRDARHHCHAFVVGPDQSVTRSNDDGEPSGTAGAPILNAVLSGGLSDVVVVVTRWFGGTLLGTGGLIRAYGGVAADALATAGRLDRQLVKRVHIRAGHHIAGALTPILHTAATVLDVEYGSDVAFTIATHEPEQVRARLAAELRASSSGSNFDFTIAGHLWVDA